MLHLVNSLGALRFGELMAVYAQSNRERGRTQWPDEPEQRQIQLAEEEFWEYLHDVFFKLSGAVYAVWEIDGKYVSALRLEPYRDGLLLEGLETAPEERGKGCAAALMKAVLERPEMRGTIYSHVDKHNAPSLKAHETCGFRITSDHAAYIDGSVSDRAYTLCITI